mgnify:FL=1
METTVDKIRRVGKRVIEMLVEKNQAYGDSATSPVNIFSKGNAVDSLCARIDDKLSRIKDNETITPDVEDTVEDLVGYLILLLIAREDDGIIEINLPDEPVDVTEGKTWETTTT